MEPDGRFAASGRWRGDEPGDFDVPGPQPGAMLRTRLDAHPHPAPDTAALWEGGGGRGRGADVLSRDYAGPAGSGGAAAPRRNAGPPRNGAEPRGRRGRRPKRARLRGLFGRGRDRDDAHDFPGFDDVRGFADGPGFDDGPQFDDLRGPDDLAGRDFGGPEVLRDGPRRPAAADWGAPPDPRSAADPRAMRSSRGMPDPRGLPDSRDLVDRRGGLDPRGVPDPRGGPDSRDRPDWDTYRDNRDRTDTWTRAAQPAADPRTEFDPLDRMDPRDQFDPRGRTEPWDRFDPRDGADRFEPRDRAEPRERTDRPRRGGPTDWSTGGDPRGDLPGRGGPGGDWPGRAGPGDDWRQGATGFAEGPDWAPGVARPGAAEPRSPEPGTRVTDWAANSGTKVADWAPAAERSVPAARGDRDGPPAIFSRPAVPVRERGAGRWVLRGLFWAGLVAVVVPWWLDTTAETVGRLPAMLTAGGRITGLIGGYLLLVQVLLTSRLPLLDRWIGTRHLLLWHRELGGSLVIIIFGHIGLILYGYAGFEEQSVVTQTKTVLTTYEDMISAAVAAGILAGMGLLGIRRLRRAMRYELWHALHLSTYLILLLGYGHQFANGQQMAADGPVRYGWIGLYGLVVAALVWGRVIAPLRLNLRHRFKVVMVDRETPDTASVYVAGRALHRLDARAGQFFRWRFLTKGRWWQCHPFSLSAAPNDSWLRLTAKAVGDHTRGLATIPAGTRVIIEGPFGDFTAARRARSQALLIACGSGIAPIRAVIEELPPGATVIYRARENVDVAFEQELDWLSTARDTQVTYVVGRRDDPGPRRLMSPEGLRELVPDISERDVYLCGPPEFVEATIKLLRRLRVPRSNVHVDPFEF